MGELWNQNPAGRPGKLEMEEFTRDRLALFDGKEGRPAYVAVNGLVYDMTEFPHWAGGIHNGIPAGADQTMYFSLCHKPEVLMKMRVVGRLVD